MPNFPMLCHGELKEDSSFEITEDQNAIHRGNPGLHQPDQQAHRVAKFAPKSVQRSGISSVSATQDHATAV